VKRRATLSRETIWFLALFVGYLAVVGVLDLACGSKLLAVGVTLVFFCAVILVRPPHHWLDWLQYAVAVVVGVLWIADLLRDWALWLALLIDLGLILLERKVDRG
jgi:predicted RNA methylase